MRWMLAVQVARRGSSLTRYLRHLGAIGLFFLAILDSSPLPTFGGPDILIVFLVATRPNPWYEYAAVATAGSIIGAYITFSLARRAGIAYIDSKFGKRKIPRILKFCAGWETAALVASTAVPFPFPTSVFFAAAGVSDRYSLRKFLGIVAAARAVRYCAVALVAHIYGRRIIRVLRHPTQHLGWLLAFAAIFAVVIGAGMLINRRIAAEPERKMPLAS